MSKTLRRRVPTLSLPVTGLIAVAAMMGCPSDPVTPQHLLEVHGDGTGDGSVTASPSGVDCTVAAGNEQGSCNVLYDENTQVTLTATPSAGSTFSGWSGACAGTGACDVTMDEARSVTVTFDLSSHVLEVTKVGSGSGTVTSNPVGIDCGSDCSASYAWGSVVMLTAAPSAGSTFDGWSGACGGMGTCEVTMDQARSVTATFTVTTSQLTVSKSGSGAGTVTSSPAGIDCGADCAEDFPWATQVTLTATAAAGSVFDGWSGACSGAGSCEVIMDQQRTVTARFEVVRQFELTVSGAGTGTGGVTSSPAGIICVVAGGVASGDCSEVYDEGTQVTLTATPAAGSTFDGWSGACTGMGPCQVTMHQARSVTATFSLTSHVLTLIPIAGLVVTFTR